MKIYVAHGYIDQGQLWADKTSDRPKRVKGETPQLMLWGRAATEHDVPEALFARWVAAQEEYEAAEEALAAACGIDYPL